MQQQPIWNRKEAFAPVEDRPGLPRVLLIGDSISIGYTLFVREMLNDVANVHRIPENGGPTSNGVGKLEAWLGAAPWDVIHFNFGLHDIRRMDGGQWQVPMDGYEGNLRRIVARLSKTGAKLIFAATTPVPQGRLSPPRVPGDEITFNGIAARVMRENGVEWNDLHAFSREKLAEWQVPANVHFHEEGSRALAREVARVIRKALGLAQ
ncbi:MAG: SGNH/GDSL hydrolase family protein [Bryobacteraceae bacterium]|nr:SGNH/GDSL hydrolase family protein [Bryobacteraceae bacterium]